MSYEIRFSPKAARAYRGLPANVKQRIDNKLDYLRTTPRGGDTVKLAGMDAYRTRVGDYRIIYEIHDQALIIWIVDIGHRRDIYR